MDTVTFQTNEAKFLGAAKFAPGGKIVVNTINPAYWRNQFSFCAFVRFNVVSKTTGDNGVLGHGIASTNKGKSAAAQDIFSSIFLRSGDGHCEAEWSSSWAQK